MKGLKIRPVEKVAFAAFLLSLNMILNRLVGLAQVGLLFSFARITPGTSITLFASLLLGPFYGAFVGVAGDALGWVLMGQWTGAFNFFLSIYYACVGILPYFVAKLLGLAKSEKVPLVVCLVGFLALFAVAFALVWTAPGIEGLFVKANFDVGLARIIVSVIFAVFALGTFVGFILLYKKKFGEKKMIGGLNLPICFAVALAVELFAVFAKSGCFVAFYSLILGTSVFEATGLDYWGLVVINTAFAAINVPLNAYLLSLYCTYSHHMIRENSREEA